jgi:hypothetical protein
MKATQRTFFSIGLGGCLVWLAVAALCFAGWVTHVVVCLKNDEWGFLIAGALVFPIAVIHGWGVWFGIW